MQSTAKALGSEQPCIHDPLNTSHWLFLHVEGHTMAHPGKNLSLVQP